MLLKIPLLIGVAYLWVNTRNTMMVASVWGLAILLLGLLTQGFSFWVFAGAGVSFLLCLGVVALLEYSEGSGFQWLAGFAGITVLLLVA